MRLIKLLTGVAIVAVPLLGLVGTAGATEIDSLGASVSQPIPADGSLTVQIPYNATSISTFPDAVIPNPPPAGTLTLSVDGVVVCTYAVPGNGSFAGGDVCTVTVATPGAHSAEAVFTTGGQSYSSGPQTLTIDPSAVVATTTTTVPVATPPQGAGVLTSTMPAPNPPPVALSPPLAFTGAPVWFEVALGAFLVALGLAVLAVRRRRMA
jgi:hypothetical protein